MPVLRSKALILTGRLLLAFAAGCQSSGNRWAAKTLMHSVCRASTFLRAARPGNCHAYAAAMLRARGARCSLSTHGWPKVERGVGKAVERIGWRSVSSRRMKSRGTTGDNSHNRLTTAQPAQFL